MLYKDAGRSLNLTRLGDVEHEAYVTLLAERADVRVPTVVVAGVAGPKAALLVIRPVDGERMRRRRPRHNLRRAARRPLGAGATAPRRESRARRAQHASRHRRGRRRNDHRLRRAATGSATEAQRARDVAELLVSTADRSGTTGRSRQCSGVIGHAAVVGALPLIQPAALTGDLRAHKRKERKARNKEIETLREATAATAVGTEEPPLQQLYRVSGTNLMMAIGTLIAVFALLSQVGDPETFYETIKNANWWWLVVAMFISLLTNFATAIALMGTVPITLPLIRTAELQLSMSFSNLAVPAVGGMAAQIRFLQTPGRRPRVGGGVGRPAHQRRQHRGAGDPARVRSRAVAHEHPHREDPHRLDRRSRAARDRRDRRGGGRDLRGAEAPEPRDAVDQERVDDDVGCGALAATRRAAARRQHDQRADVRRGDGRASRRSAASLNYWTLLSINIFVSTIASLVPIPGGGTAVSSVGMSGALVAVGVSNEVAVAAVLANQLVANFIPAVPGWWATNDLLHDEYL